MAKTTTLALTATVVGDQYNPSATINGGANVPSNTNAAAPTVAVLSSGNNTITAPSGVTVNGCLVVPPPSSTNTKIYKGIAGDTGFTGTFQPVLVPVAAAGTFVINAAAGETVVLVFV